MSMMLIQKYSFNEMTTVPLELLCGFLDTTIEITVPQVVNIPNRYKGEFQNMGPKLRAVRSYQKDPHWLYDVK